MGNEKNKYDLLLICPSPLILSYTGLPNPARKGILGTGADNDLQSSIEGPKESNLTAEEESREGSNTDVEGEIDLQTSIEDITEETITSGVNTDLQAIEESLHNKLKSKTKPDKHVVRKTRFMQNFDRFTWLTEKSRRLGLLVLKDNSHLNSTRVVF